MTQPQSRPADWHCATANSDGFIELRKLKERALVLTPEAFVDEFPASALRLFTSDSHPLAEMEEGDDHGVQLLTISIKSAAILRYLGKVAFIAKRPGNFLAHLVSIGRSSRNDIVIGVESISKVHGYFSWEEESGLCFTDHSSTNGSRRNDEPLTPGLKYALKDRDVLQVGLEVQLEFLTPASLYQRARRS